MERLYIAVALYIGVFGIDYLFYVKQKSLYSYVSRRTFSLFVTAQACAVWLFYDIYTPFLSQFWSEFVFLAVLTLLLSSFTYILVKDRLYVCNISSRSERCLTPGYVLVKGAEIVFQHMIYLVLALSLTSLLGIQFYTYFIFVLLVLAIHTILVLSCNKTVLKRLTFGIFAISVPIFYVHVHLEMFWPAVYLHSIMYVFYWLTFANFDIEPLKVETSVE